MKNKSSVNGHGNGAAAAFDSKVAAANHGPVPFRPDDIAIMDGLMENFERAKRAAEEAYRRVQIHAQQCAERSGISVQDFDINWDLKAFVPKVKANGQAVAH